MWPPCRPGRRHGGWDSFDPSRCVALARRFPKGTPRRGDLRHTSTGWHAQILSFGGSFTPFGITTFPQRFEDLLLDFLDVLHDLLLASKTRSLYRTTRVYNEFTIFQSENPFG
jgi:hypothetical protein